MVKLITRYPQYNTKIGLDKGGKYTEKCLIKFVIK